MELLDLKEGAKLILEVVWGSTKYEIPTTVAASTPDGVLIAPFTYKGKVLDFNSRYFNNMVYNIYYINNSNTRITWRSVLINTLKMNNKNYYIVQTNNFAKFSSSGERRDHKRIPLNIKGSIIKMPDNNEVLYPVTIADISDNGISFLALPGMDIYNKKLKVYLNDFVRGEDFNLIIMCTCVRRMTQNGLELYGCKIQTPPQDLLAYVFLKQLPLY